MSPDSASTDALRRTIESAWETRADVTSDTGGDIRRGVEACLSGLDDGSLRVAHKSGDAWQVNEWLKKAILLSFRLNDSWVMGGGPPDEGVPGAQTSSPVERAVMNAISQEISSAGQGAAPTGQAGAWPGTWYDKVAPKTAGWDDKKWAGAGYRCVPPAAVRRGAYVAPGVVLMPSFVNIGAYVDGGTMIDTWATVGSCAQIGRDCHISGGAGIGGVLEPLQSAPVIIEDDCFIGARSEIAEGVIVERGSVISMGVYIGASTKIVDRRTGAVTYGRVPAYSVVVPGTLPGDAGGPSLYCAVIVKRVDAKTRSKTSINALLRD